jgi:hypothetical protein
MAMAMAMTMAGKQNMMNFGAKLSHKRAVVVVVILGVLCMPHGRVICLYEHYTTPNRQNGR